MIYMIYFVVYKYSSAFRYIFSC